MKGSRVRSGVAAMIAVVGLLAGSVSAEEVTVRNDSFDGGSVVIVGEFIAGEQAGVVLTSPCDGTIVALQVLWLAQGSPGFSIHNALRVHNAGAFPAPGSEILELEGPVLTPGAINEFRFIDDMGTIPIAIPVTMGQQFVVALEFGQTSNPSTGSVCRDVNGCQNGRNMLFAIPGGWFNFCLLLSGDVIIRAVVDCGVIQNPSVAFDTTSSLFGENDGLASVEVGLSSAAGPSGASVMYSVIGGSAVGGGVDYTLLGTGTLNFASGASAGLIGLTFVNDMLNENDETVIIQLHDAVNLTLGNPLSHTITIVDDDSGPGVPANPSPSDLAVNVPVATNFNWDDTTDTDTYDITLWKSSEMRPATPTATGLLTSDFDPPADLDFETEYLWQVTSNGASGSAQGAAWRFFTVNAPIVPRFSFAQATSMQGENAGLVSVQVNLSIAADVGGATVQFEAVGGTATGGGTDYTLAGNGTLTINQGGTSGLIGIFITDDILVEGNETIILELSNPTGGELGTTIQHTLTITDNDTGPDEPSDPSPDDAATNVAVDGILDWADSAGATGYEVRLWLASEARPETPTAGGLLVSEFDPPGDLMPDTDYVWEVIARSGDVGTVGPQWTFRTAGAAGIGASGVALR